MKITSGETVIVDTDNCPDTPCEKCLKCAEYAAWDYHAKTMRSRTAGNERDLLDGEQGA